MQALASIAEELRCAANPPPDAIASGERPRADLTLVLGTVGAARRALVGDRPSHYPEAVDAVSAFLEALSAVLTDLGRDLVDSQAEAAELACGLARALGVQACV